MLGVLELVGDGLQLSGEVEGEELLDFEVDFSFF